MRGRFVVAAVVLLVVAWWLWPSGKRYPPGVLVPADPTITLVEGASPFPFESKDKRYDLTPRARYALQARVLSKNTDYADSLIGPLDLTVGWGPMSDQAVLDRMEIWQDNTRHWFCKPKGEWPIPVDQVALHAVNTHLIPSSPQVETQLLALGKGDLVSINGTLVDVSRPDGFHWNTSVDASGFGDHSCKIVWVEKVSLLPPPRR